ncbi:MAG TPA: hypothetical protein VKB02_15295 [Pyrinomonadaceae bacterium]|nr:hypothetical protein [Pyrinomonadaceae bacterium]
MFERSYRIFIAAIVLIGLVSVAAAQRNPTMPTQVSDSDKEQLYARFVENKKVPSSDRQRLAYEDAKDYVRRFGNDVDPHLAEVRRFVVEYERVMKNYELHEAYAAKKYAKAFEIGRKTLKKEPENFYVLATLTEAGYDNAQTGDVTLNEETIGYAKSALAIVESGKLTSFAPFAMIEDARGVLNFALGWFLRAQSPVEAADAFSQAINSGGRFKDDPLIYNLLGIAILKGEYVQVAADYNTKFGNKPPSPEQQAAWQRVVKLGERVIDAYARAVALSTRPEQAEGKAKMLAHLTSLYKHFHNNSDAGLSDLIATVLSKPLP